MAEQSIICCCGAIVWTRVIAWFQIVVSFLTLLFCTAQLVDKKDSLKLWVDTKEVVDPDKLTDAILVLEIMCVVQSLLTLCFAAILLIGVNNKKLSHLTAWMIFTAGTTIIYIVTVSLETRVLAVHSDGGVAIFQCLIAVIIRSFGIWVVYSLREEILIELKLGDAKSKYVNQVV